MKATKWWQEAVFYQIYPRSFADGNGDGIGDFRGMIAHLDYLSELGVDALWLSPHYPSPFFDCGYDITDFAAVGSEYGTLDEFRHFLRASHERGLRVILDLVLNHSSHLHPWFIVSRSDRKNPKRDWYIWRDPAPGGGPPNNWASIFGSSAWTHDERTGQYYYHAFLPEQPDLNWRNPAVKAAMWDAVRFWLDLGVDGFRLDAIATIFEHPELPDHTLPVGPEGIFDANQLPLDQYWQLLQHQLKQPGLHELMRELRALIDSYPGDRVLVGEDEDVAFHGHGDELHLIFNFPLMRARQLMPAHIRSNQLLRLAALPAGAWPCNTLGNHDSPRVWSSYGDGAHNLALARLHLALMLTLKGTPFLFNGEELGMADLELSDLGQLRDAAAINQFRHLVELGGQDRAVALRHVLRTTRDRCRSPMQWSDEANAGFSAAAATPWLPVHPNYAEGVNVAAQINDPASLLSFYQAMLALRRATPALSVGDYEPLHTDSETYLAFVRHDSTSGQRCLVLLNFVDEAQAISIDAGSRSARVRFSSERRKIQSLDLTQVVLTPFEVLIIDLA